jgi:glutamine amidotransferase
MEIVIIQYNAGNIQSVLYALERIGTTAVVTDNVELIKSADKVIFPGVGEASTAMAYLKERNLDAVIKNLQQPVLGICLGMQLMCAYSEENNTTCLGVFEENVCQFKTADPVIKVPQIGWNTSYAYFVHGYYAALGAHTIATSNYIQPYSSALNKDNFYGVQFHPEKSAKVGEQIIKNFLELT